MILENFFILILGSLLLPRYCKSPNLLFIVADDLRPELNLFYGQNNMVAPAIDSLQNRGTVFTRAYTQSALCAAIKSILFNLQTPGYNAYMDHWTLFSRYHDPRT